MKTYGLNRHKLDRHTKHRQVLFSILFFIGCFFALMLLVRI